MKAKRNFLIITLALLVLLLIWLNTIPSPVSAANRLGRWEYASFLKAPPAICAWQTADESWLGRNIEGLCKDLGIKYNPNKISDHTIFRYAGNHGWEFVEIEKTAGDSTRYWFMRPK